MMTRLKTIVALMGMPTGRILGILLSGMAMLGATGSAFAERIIYDNGDVYEGDA